MLPLVIVVEQVDGGVRRYAFADSPVSIGRSPFAELQLSEPFISRWEGTLRFDAQEITYFSLGETNSTYLDGHAIAASEQDIALAVDSVLTLGELKLRFAREPVPERDLRRKGKRRPTRADADTGVKTVYLDAAEAWEAPRTAALGAAGELGGAVPGLASPRTAALGAAGELGGAVPGLASPPTAAAGVLSPRAGVRVVSGSGAATSEPTVIVDAVHQGSVVVIPSTHIGPQRTPSTAEDLTLALRHRYRAARTALVTHVRQQLAALPEAERAQYLQQLVQSEPALASEPELQTELQRAGVSAPNDIPELREWLRAIKSDLLPEQVRFDSRQTLTRVLGLVEALVQSLAEIHDAQESVRRRWLGRSQRRSVLQSDQGKIVLSYLLNPHADWNERLRELESSVRDAVTHELALFRATLDGARTLVNAVSPEAVCEADEADSGELATAEPSFWERVSGAGKHLPQARLWQRFLGLHQELSDGARYERVFLGRVFARSYLAAMGKPASAG
jgi:hypothetical protein